MPASEEEEPTYIDCYNCGETMEEDDAYTNDWDSRYRCCSCNDDFVLEMEEQQQQDEESDLIHNYGHKPSAIFLNADGHRSYYASQYTDEQGRLRNQLYLGLELELEVGRTPREDCAAFVVSKINGDNDDSVVYLKEDGSLEHGFEIVSHPMTLDYATSKFAWDGISGLIKKGCKSWDAHNCGLHIHMSRNAFVDEKHIFKFMKFLYNNSDEMIAFAGRNVSYAKWDKDALLGSWRDYNETTGSYEKKYSTSFMKLAKGEETNHDRYVAVNIQNRHTIELRFFRPSLNPNTVISAMQMCEALFAYTDTECNTPNVMSGNALAFRSFASWVKTQPRYSTLSERIAVRCSKHGDDN